MSVLPRCNFYQDATVRRNVVDRGCLTVTQFTQVAGGSYFSLIVVYSICCTAAVVLLGCVFVSLVGCYGVLLLAVMNFHPKLLATLQLMAKPEVSVKYCQLILSFAISCKPISTSPVFATMAMNHNHDANIHASIVAMINSLINRRSSHHPNMNQPTQTNPRAPTTNCQPIIAAISHGYRPHHFSNQHKSAYWSILVTW